MTGSMRISIEMREAIAEMIPNGDVSLIIQNGQLQLSMFRRVLWGFVNEKGRGLLGDIDAIDVVGGFSEAC